MLGKTDPFIWQVCAYVHFIVCQLFLDKIVFKILLFMLNKKRYFQAKRKTNSRSIYLTWYKPLGDRKGISESKLGGPY